MPNRQIGPSAHVRAVILRFATISIGVILLSNPATAKEDAGTPLPKSKVVDRLTAVGVRQVKIGGEIGRRIGLTIEGNLLKIDLDKDFIAPFQSGGLGGIVNDGSGPYVGLGKTLDGMVPLAANTGNKALEERKDDAMGKLLATQEPGGYIGYLPPDKRTWTPWDVHEQSYTIMALVSDYHCFGMTRSLEAARKLADYIIGRWPTMPKDWAQRIPAHPQNILGGSKEAFLLLYHATGDRRYLDFCVNELEADDWDWPIVLGRSYPIMGHVYGYFYHCLVQLDLYRLTSDAKMLKQTQRAVDFMLTGDGMGITGGAGQAECWTDDQIGSGHYAETCATAHQIFTYDNLLRLHGDSRWGDLIERTLYNAAFAAQSPDGRQIRYYAPFEGPRVYFGYDGYCCPGNFRRLMGYVPKLVYYRVGNGLAVDLYTASRVTFDQGGCRVDIRQETDFPTSGHVTLHVAPSKPARFPLMLRVPRWCTGAKATVNGKPVKAVATAGRFLKIERTWKSGDEVVLDMPMAWRLVAGRKTQAGRAAIVRGPIVYTLSPSRNPELAGIDLKRLVILPSTIELVAPDDSVRPGGTSCRVRADLDTPGKGALTLTLTEFPDPDGQWTYFQLADPSVAVADELVTRIKI